MPSYNPNKLKKLKSLEERKQQLKQWNVSKQLIPQQPKKKEERMVNNDHWIVWTKNIRLSFVVWLKDVIFRKSSLNNNF